MRCSLETRSRDAPPGFGRRRVCAAFARAIRNVRRMHWPSFTAITVVFVTMLFLASITGRAAEQPFRFPPPEFESGYELPVTAQPPARELAMQYLDVFVLLAALGLAACLILQKRSRTGIVALSIFSLIYFGFYRKGCVCAIGSLQNVSLALFNSDYALPLTIAAFFFAPLLAALFVGRAFCSGVCPHGALQDLMLIRPVTVPPWLERGLGLLPFVYLGAGVVFSATGSAFVICAYDPFIAIFRLGGSITMLSLGAALLVLGMFVGRPYCRFLCPYGALLRMTSAVSKWRVTVTPDVCTQCRLCEDSCPYGALQTPATDGANPGALRMDRRRLGWLLALVPALVLAGGWTGSMLTVPASRVDPEVELAERFIRQQINPEPLLPQTKEALSLQRAAQDPLALLERANAIRQRFALAGWLFGGWVGLVVGVKLISLSVRRRRTDYEPDRAACFGCARCFSSCPNERIRAGLAPIRHPVSDREAREPSERPAALT